jgi:hypothetical protein
MALSILLRAALLLLCAVASAGAGAGESLRVHSPVRSSCRPLRLVGLPVEGEHGVAGRTAGTLRLRGGSGNNNCQAWMENVGAWPDPLLGASRWPRSEKV